MGHLGPDDRPYDVEEQERLARALFELTAEISVSPALRLDVPTLLGWHRRLSAGIGRMHPGAFRETDITFGSWYGIVPALIPDRVQVLLSDIGLQIETFEQERPFAGAQEQLSTVIRIGCQLHLELIRIHPFADGNGRLARLAQNWTHRRFGLALVSFPERKAYLSALNRALYTNHLELLETLTLLSMTPSSRQTD